LLQELIQKQLKVHMDMRTYFDYKLKDRLIVTIANTSRTFNINVNQTRIILWSTIILTLFAGTLLLTIKINSIFNTKSNIIVQQTQTVNMIEDGIRWNKIKIEEINSNLNMMIRDANSVISKNKSNANIEKSTGEIDNNDQ